MISLSGTTIDILCDEKYLDSTTIIPNTIYCQDFNYNYLGDYYEREETTSPIEEVYTDLREVLSQTELILKTKALLFDLALAESKKTTISSIPKFTRIGSEIREMSEDMYFNKILRHSLAEINFLLEKENLNYQINVTIEEDIEIPEWKEILFLIKISKIKHEELIRLWKNIGENVRKKIELIEIENESIKKQCENISIILEEFE